MVGEVGLPRREYLYDLTYCDIVLILRGYEQRHRHLWSATRWQTFYLMSAQVGSDGMRKANLNRPTDLIQFPWERDTPGDLPTEEEAQQMLAEMEAINAQLQQEQDSEPQ